jgi:hypothetical protein
MYSLIGRVGLLVVMCAAGACHGDDREVTPEAQQLARINRELATLRESEESLHARVDRLENARAAAGVTRVDGAAAEVLTIVVTDAALAPYYLIDEQPVAEAQLELMIREYAARVAKPEVPEVIVETGANVPYERVVHVIDVLHELGITRVALHGAARASP